MESGEVLALGNPCETAKPHSRISAQGVAVWSAAPISFAPSNPLKAWRVERYWRWATHAKRQSPAGFRPNGWPFGLQSRSRLGTFEPAKSMESGEVLALGNPCETAKPHSRIPAQGVAVWSAAPISFRHLRTR